MSTPGLVTVVAVVVVVAIVGTLLRARSGRVRTTSAAGPTAGPDGWELAGVRPESVDRVLLLQLSSPVCTPCRRTAEVLGALAARENGLRHVEVDVAERIEVARALGVLRTPTTVAFGRDGAEMLRVSGVPDVEELRGALADRTG